MNILVICGFELGSIKAHAINTINLAHGFHKLDRADSVTVYARCNEAEYHKKLSSWLNEFHFLNKLKVYGYASYDDLEAKLKIHNYDFAYLRDFKSLSICNKLQIKCVVESHAPVGSTNPDFKEMISKLVSNNCVGLSTINEALRDYYIACGAPKKKTRILSDCVDWDHYEVLRSSPVTNFDSVYYVGHLYNYKGILTFIRSAKKLKSKRFVIVGGSPRQIAFWKALNSVLNIGMVNNVEFRGWIKHKDLPHNLIDAAMFVLPPEKWHRSSLWTSPVKLGEYLASGRPTICSDIPALRRWVSEDEVNFFEAGNPESLVEKIIEVSKSEQNAKLDGQLILAMKMDYKIKAKKLVDFAGDAV